MVTFPAAAAAEALQHPVQAVPPRPLRPLDLPPPAPLRQHRAEPRSLQLGRGLVVRLADHRRDADEARPGGDVDPDARTLGDAVACVRVLPEHGVDRLVARQLDDPGFQARVGERRELLLEPREAALRVQRL